MCSSHVWLQLEPPCPLLRSPTPSRRNSLGDQGIRAEVRFVRTRARADVPSLRQQPLTYEGTSKDSLSPFDGIGRYEREEESPMGGVDLDSYGSRGDRSNDATGPNCLNAKHEHETVAESFGRGKGRDGALEDRTEVVLGVVRSYDCSILAKEA